MSAAEHDVHADAGEGYVRRRVSMADERASEQPDTGEREEAVSQPHDKYFHALSTLEVCPLVHARRHRERVS